MSLISATLTWEVFLACSSHAHLTENEEIMGLLLGDWNENHTHVNIWEIINLSRSDRRKDRVEISPEQLALAVQNAESITKQIGKVTRVVGWYHSHPHITVRPSHIDVRTQGEYQMLDKGFLGLILSVFDKSAGDEVGEYHITAFQSTQKNTSVEGYRWEERQIPLEISSSSVHNLVQETPLCDVFQHLLELHDIAFGEERKIYSAAVTRNSIQERIQNDAIYEQSLCEMMNVATLPLLQHINAQLQAWNDKIDELEKEEI